MQACRCLVVSEGCIGLGPLGRISEAGAVGRWGGKSEPLLRSWGVWRISEWGGDWSWGESGKVAAATMSWVSLCPPKRFPKSLLSSDYLMAEPSCTANSCNKESIIYRLWQIMCWGTVCLQSQRLGYCLHSHWNQIVKEHIRCKMVPHHLHYVSRFTTLSFCLNIK